MKKTVEVKLWLDPKTGKFSQKEVNGQPYITAHQEVEVEKKKVAFIDKSASQRRENLEHYIEKAKEMGITEFYFFSDHLEGPYNISDFKMPDYFDGPTLIYFIDTLPEEIEPVIFSDGDISHNLRIVKRPYLSYVFSIDRN